MRDPKVINQEIRDLMAEYPEVFEKYTDLAMELLTHKDQSLFLLRFSQNERKVLRLERTH